LAVRQKLDRPFDPRFIFFVIHHHSSLVGSMFIYFFLTKKITPKRLRKIDFWAKSCELFRTFLTWIGSNDRKEAYTRKFGLIFLRFHLLKIRSFLTKIITNGVYKLFGKFLTENQVLTTLSRVFKLIFFPNVAIEV
jgi:hypothetical protein